MYLYVCIALLIVVSTITLANILSQYAVVACDDSIWYNSMWYNAVWYNDSIDDSIWYKSKL